MNTTNTPRPSLSQKSSSARLLAVMAALSLAAAPAAHAANDLWIGNTNANFATLSNWTGSVSPANNTPQFGAAGSSGTTLNNDLTGATFAGITFNSGASAFTIGGNAFTLNGGITNSGTSLQTINNDMTFSNGAKTLAGGAGGLTLGGTNTYSVATAALTITGTVNLAGSLTMTASSGSSGFLTLAGAQTLNLTGGTLTINAIGAPNSIIGQNAAGTSNLNLSGGNLVVGANGGFVLGNNVGTAIGVMTISSGTATINRGTTATTTNGTDTRLFELGRDGATGTVNLNGGTLATDRQIVRDGSSGAGTGTANFVFGGGTLKALANQTDWLQSATATIAGQNNGSGTGTLNTNALALSSVTTTSVNSKIDSNGFTVGINNAITGSGGLHIIDSSATTGVVNFGGASYAYTGPTSVDSGTLNTNAASVAFSGNLAVAGGKLTLNGAGAGSVSTPDFSMSSGTWTVSIGDTVSTTGNMSITSGVLDAAAFSGSEANYTIVGYTLFTSIGGTGSVGGLSIIGYDTANYIASLSNAGVLSFAAVPEPSAYASLAGVLMLGVAALRRRPARRSATTSA